MADLRDCARRHGQTVAEHKTEFESLLYLATAVRADERQFRTRQRVINQATTIRTSRAMRAS